MNTSHDSENRGRIKLSYFKAEHKLGTLTKEYFNQLKDSSVDLNQLNKCLCSISFHDIFVHALGISCPITVPEPNLILKHHGSQTGPSL